MSDNLITGDRCYFVAPKSGLKLRCIVVDSLGLRAKGESRMIAVVRDIKRRAPARIRLEGPIREPRVKLIDRDKLRKLPPKATTTP